MIIECNAVAARHLLLPWPAARRLRRADEQCRGHGREKSSLAAAGRLRAHEDRADNTQGCALSR